mgnify:CR=1 FL=1
MKPDGNIEEKAEIIKDAVSLIHRFNRAFRTSKIYDSNNLIYRRQIDLFQHLADKLLDIYGKAQITLRENGVYFNDIIFKIFLWKKSPHSKKQTIRTEIQNEYFSSV